MGILRADVVSHSQLEPTGGSIYLDGTGDYLSIASADAFTFGAGSFTFECWVNRPSLSGNTQICGSSNDNFNLYMGSDGTVSFYNGGNITTSSTIDDDTWTHVAMCREGTGNGQMRVFINGVEGVNGTNSTTYAVGTLLIGRNTSSGTTYGKGYISNVRLTRTAEYKQNFTVPKFELENIPGTILLCCRSSSSATASDITYATITSSGDTTASAVTPDVKKDITDAGVVLGDNTKFDTLSYLVPPGGTTTQSNRGRGVFGGYYAATSNQTLDYISIQSMGNAVSFGELVQRASSAGCFASSTRGIWCGGYSAPDGALTDTIQYVTIATQSNAIDFGNLTVGGRKLVAGLSNNTRGINVGGHVAPTATNIIDYVTIATTGNATNFGDLTANALYCAAAGNTTRGIVYLGAPANPTSTNAINYVTIASAGNATDFGDATQAVQFRGGLAVSNSTRVVAAGGFDAPVNSNVIDYVTIATTGDATDFGDLTVVSHGGASMTNSIRGVWAGTYHGAPSPYNNSMEYITIATLGNGADFGDNTVSDTGYCSGCSDSHGGIS